MSTEGRTRPLGNQQCPTSYLLFDFAKGSSALKPEHRRMLTTIARVMRGNRGGSSNRDVLELPAAKLVGRASRSGSDASNLQLSQKRVEEVAQFLRGQGVLPAQIESRGIGEGAPFSAAQESEDDRSVEVHLKLPRMLRVFLAHADRVRPTAVLFQVIREAFDPVFRAGDRELNLVSTPPGEIADTDIGIVFDRENRPFLGREPNRRFGFQFMGNEDGTVDLAQFEELRVGSFLRDGAGGRRDPGDPRQIDHVSQTEPLFQNGEREFAHALANTAVHEIAHQLGEGHNSDPSNFMSGIQFPPLDARSRQLLRRMIVGPKHFTREQIERLACSVRKGVFRGVELAPPSASRSDS